MIWPQGRKTDYKLKPPEVSKERNQVRYNTITRVQTFYHCTQNKICIFNFNFKLVYMLLCLHNDCIFLVIQSQIHNKTHRKFIVEVANVAAMMCLSPEANSHSNQCKTVRMFSLIRVNDLNGSNCWFFVLLVSLNISVNMYFLENIQFCSTVGLLFISIICCIYSLIKSVITATY